MSDAHHDFSKHTAHCECLENEVDDLRADNALLRAALEQAETSCRELSKTSVLNTTSNRAYRCAEAIASALAGQSEGDPR